MKNLPKNNYSKNNKDNKNRTQQSKTYFKSNNLNDLKRNNSRNGKNSDFKDLRKNDSARNGSNNSKSYDPHKNNHQFSQKRSRTNNYNPDSLAEGRKINNPSTINIRNFDDWIWGKHSAFSCMSSDRPINRIWCTPEIFSSEKFYLVLKDLKSKGVLIEEVSWSRISQLTSGAVHQGVALQLASSNTISLSKLIESAKSKSSNPILIALDGITDPHNLGAIIRSAEAFDCKGIIIPQRRSAGLTGTVAKVAAGALDHIPVSRVVNLNRALDELKKKGFLSIGLSGDALVPISKFDEKGPLVIVVGAENKGISLLTQKNCDFLLKIPLTGKTSSLNASVAAAISLYHLTNK